MSEYAWIIPDYAWISQNMLDYARMCVNIPKSASMAFVLHVPIVIPCLLEYVFTYLKKVYGLKERGTVFLKWQNFNYSILAKNIWFVFWL